MSTEADLIWTIRGISKGTRDLVKTAAQRQKIAVGAFVESTLRASANNALALPDLTTESGDSVRTSDLMEIAAEVKLLRERIERLEQGTQVRSEPPQELQFEDERMLLLKLIHVAGLQQAAIKEQLIAVLLNALKVADDPWLMQQLLPIIKEARKT